MNDLDLEPHLSLTIEPSCWKRALNDFLTMKNLVIAILVFCAFICSGHTLRCLSCENDDHGVDYTMKDCLKDQKVVYCPADYSDPTNYTCFRYHYTTTRGDEKEARGCVEKRACENFMKLCNEGTDEQKKQGGIKECESAACCEQHGDETIPPCNSARTFKCFACGNDDRGVNYTTKDCLKDQVEVDCPADNNDFTCYRWHFTTTRGEEKEYRGCTQTKSCKSFTKICKGTDEQKKQERIKECKTATCCVSDGDTPCNGEDDGSTPTVKSSGFTVPIDMLKIIFAAMCGLKLFLS